MKTSRRELLISMIEVFIQLDKMLLTDAGKKELQKIS